MIIAWLQLVVTFFVGSAYSDEHLVDDFSGVSSMEEILDSKSSCALAGQIMKCFFVDRLRQAKRCILETILQEFSKTVLSTAECIQRFTLTKTCLFCSS